MRSLTTKNEDTTQMPPRRTPKPSNRQKRYLRFLERSCDEPTHLGLTRSSAIGIIATLEAQYRLIYGRQPTMR